MKKIILLILANFIFSSCSLMDLQQKSIDSINKATNEAINKIYQEAALLSANQADSIINSVSQRINSLLDKSISDINIRTEQKIQDHKKKTLLLSCLCICLCLAGIAISIISMYEVHKTRDEINKQALEGIIKKILKEEKAKECQLEYGLIENKKLEEKIRSIISEDEIIGSIASKIAQKSEKPKTGEIPVHEQKECKIKKDNDESNPLELFARDSLSSILSDVYPSHQKGKTLYKLTLEDQNSNNAVLDLCDDKEDVIGRLLRFNDEDLEAICVVKRMSLHPEKVRVIKKGRAERVSSQEWKVVEKMEIELS